MFNKEKKPKRFIVKEHQNLNLGEMMIIVDKETGVNYLVTVGVAQNGITPLLDANGNVVIDTLKDKSEM
ncbi:MAG: hypothetical protein IJZ64_01930 [Ruminococcus sp.]|nr:hypothetical protein [Ruminococcus sp.]